MSETTGRMIGLSNPPAGLYVASPVWQRRERAGNGLAEVKVRRMFKCIR